MVLEYSVTTKGKRVVLFNGYIYTLNQDRGKAKYWRCEDRTCAASVRTDGNDNYKAHTGTHNGHLPSPERIEILELKRKVKERVITETTPIARIYDQELAAANLSQTALALAPSAKDSRECLFVIRLVYLSLKPIF
jgi:FLYWCH zinc finger domain